MTESQRQRRLDLIFLLGVPGVLALTMAVAGRYTERLGIAGGLVYLAALSFVPWWIAACTTHCAHVRLKKFGLPLWAIGSIGAVCASLVMLVPVHELNAWFRAEWPGGETLAALDWSASRERIGDIAISIGRATALWVAFLYAFSTTLGWKRYVDPPVRVAPDDVDHVERIKNNGAVWSREADLELARYITSGLSPREIAVHMGRTVPAVRSRIAKQRHRGTSRFK